MKKTVVGLLTAVILLCSWLWLAGSADSSNTQAVLTTTVTDSTGREVMIPNKLQRVVILNASNLDLFCAAGGADKIVGIPTSKALSDKVRQAVENTEEVGVIHSPNVEKILSLQPDLVIGANVPYHRDLIPVLEQAGIPVIVNGLDSYEQVLSTLEFYGRLLNSEQQAAKQIAQIESEYAAAVKLGHDRTTPRNLIIFGTPDSFNIGTPVSFVGDLIERLGGNNIASEANYGKAQFIPLSMEAVAQQNPEVIFIIMHGSPDSLEQKVQQDLLANEAWADIAAVKNKRVYILPYQLFAVNPGVQVEEAIKILADYMYAN